MSTESIFDQFETWELEAVAEGDSFPHIQTVIDQNPELWSLWLQAYNEAQATFNVLYRFDCPAPAELRDYRWKMLTPARHSELAIHLTVCFSCANELQQLENVLATEEGITVEDITVEQIIAESDERKADRPSAMVQLA